MKKLLAGSAVVAALMVGGGATAFASDHSTPGTPGTPGCRGQTTAYLAQAVKNGVVDEAFHGIGGLAHFAELSVSDVQAVITQYCGQ